MDKQDRDADAESLATSRADAFLKALDKDKDGEITRQESRGSLLDRSFGRFDKRDPATNRGNNILTKEELLAGLVKFESGRDGVISADELRMHMVATRASGDGELTPEELKAAIGGYRNGMGDGPRGTPTVDGNRVYAEGGNGDAVLAPRTDPPYEGKAACVFGVSRRR